MRGSWGFPWTPVGPLDAGVLAVWREGSQLLYDGMIASYFTRHVCCIHVADLDFEFTRRRAYTRCNQARGLAR